MFPTHFAPRQLGVVLALCLAAARAEDVTPEWMNAAPVAPPSSAPFVQPSGNPPTGGFTVDTSNREEVRVFYKTVYPQSNGVPIGWTGDVSEGDEGTTSQEFRDAVLRRINFFRAMAGVPANVVFTAEYNGKCQKAALMMSANKALDHTPPTDWKFYSADGAEAAGKSNLYYGANGPKAITGFMEDFGAVNANVGHRRWFLLPQTQQMGSGDIPADGSFRPTNSTWVIDPNRFGPRPTVRDGFVAWPPPGFVPFQLVWPRWSLSHSTLDFSQATVTLTRNGDDVPVNITNGGTGSGENTIIWVEEGKNTNSPATLRPPKKDTTTEVTVSGILPFVAGQPQTFTYSVTVFDPAKAGTDSLAFQAVGTYAALLDGGSFESRGFIVIKVVGGGRFTGFVVIGGKRYSIRGTFGDDGTMPQILLKRASGASPLKLNIALSTASLPPTNLFGTLSEDGGFTAGIDAPHSFYTGKKNPTPPLVNPPDDIVGAVTVSLDTAGVAGLTGHGWAAGKISKAGTLTLKGVLADGTKWMSSGPLTTAGAAPVFAVLYGKQGALSGTVTLGPSAPRTLTGPLGWVRPADVDDGPFSAGWPGGVTATLHGGQWFPPVRGEDFDPPGFTASTGAATLNASGAGLAGPLAWDATFSSGNNRVTVEPTAGGLTAKLALDLKKGLIEGDFRPADGAKAQKYSGVLLLGENKGQGFFLNDTGSGEITVVPR